MCGSPACMHHLRIYVSANLCPCCVCARVHSHRYGDVRVFAKRTRGLRHPQRWTGTQITDAERDNIGRWFLSPRHVRNWIGHHISGWRFSAYLVRDVRATSHIAKIFLFPLTNRWVFDIVAWRTLVSTWILRNHTNLHHYVPRSTELSYISYIWFDLRVSLLYLLEKSHSRKFGFLSRDTWPVCVSRRERLLTRTNRSHFWRYFFLEIPGIWRMFL